MRFITGALAVIGALALLLAALALWAITRSEGHAGSIVLNLGCPDVMTAYKTPTISENPSTYDQLVRDLDSITHNSRIKNIYITVADTLMNDERFRDLGNSLSALHRQGKAVGLFVSYECLGPG